MHERLSDLIHEASVKDEALRLFAAVRIDAQAGEIIYVSDLALELFGYTREELYGQQVEILLPDEFKAKHPGYREEYMASPRSRPMGHGQVLFGRRKDGSVFPAQIGLSWDKRGGQMATAFVVDLTEALATVERIREASGGAK